MGIPKLATQDLMAEHTAEWLWDQLRGIYGLQWEASFGTFDLRSTSVRAWRRGLREIDPTQLRRGLAACVDNPDPEPPTLPEFRARCMGIPSFAQYEAGLPGEHAAFNEAVRERLASSNAHLMGVEQAKKIARDAYFATRERVLRGYPPSEHVRRAKPEPEKTKPVRAAPEVAMRHIQEIGAELGMRTPPG